MPEYAIKEFKAGPLRGWIWCHNKFNETHSFADTLSAINAISATLHRNFAASGRQALEQAAQADKAAFAESLGLQGQQSDIRLDRALADRYRFYLRRRITQAWNRRRTLASEVSMPLTCFVEGVLKVDGAGRLSFDRFSCPDDSSCGVLNELSRRRADVGQLMETIKAQPQKSENDKRHKALRHVFRTPKKPFSDSMCRGLGDAVFVIMAPRDSVILTTNIKDFLPLARALNKVAAEP